VWGQKLQIAVIVVMKVVIDSDVKSMQKGG
jgi:hypothetical protein